MAESSLSTSTREGTVIPMRRKSTKNTRGPNIIEVGYQKWTKHRPCAYCGCQGPSIVDHARGSCFRHRRTLIGHAFVTPKCVSCDNVKTHGNHRRHFDQLGITESEAWINEYLIWTEETKGVFDEQIIEAMTDFREYEQRLYG